jgi:hypothetical protein
MTVETMWWVSSGAFAILCLLLTLEYAEVVSTRAWLHELRSKARRSKGRQAILLWMISAILDSLWFTIWLAATPAALGLFGHLVAVFIAAPLLGALVERATERLAGRFQANTTET